MSLVNTIYLNSVEGSENRIYQAHNTAVSLVGNREDDENADKPVVSGLKDGV